MVTALLSEDQGRTIAGQRLLNTTGTDQQNSTRLLNTAHVPIQPQAPELEKTIFFYREEHCPEVGLLDKD
jgi:hypothetical protein